MKFNVGDIVRIADRYAPDSHLGSDAAWRGKIGKITERSGRATYPYEVEVFIPHPFDNKTVLRNVGESELVLLESSVGDLTPGDEVQLDDGWYVENVINRHTLEITHPNLTGSIKIASDYVHKVD